MNLLRLKNLFVLNLRNNTMSKGHHMTSVKAHTKRVKLIDAELVNLNATKQ